MVLGEGDAYLASKLYARGNCTILNIPNPGGSSPYYKNEQKEPYIRMNGQETYKFAVNAMCTDLTEVTNAAGLTIEKIA